MSGSPEQGEHNQEINIDSREVAAEQQEKLRDAIEKTAESPRNAEAKAEEARVEALETAISVERGGAEKKKPAENSSPSRRGPISKKQREASFKKQMKDVQAELPVPSRVFSKVIHNKVVEKTSEVVGGTIARPNAILSGAVCAFVLTLAVYVVAKVVGYRLSGFETIAAFIIGWAVGIIYDYLRAVITGKKS